MSTPPNPAAAQRRYPSPLDFQFSANPDPPIGQYVRRDEVLETRLFTDGFVLASAFAIQTRMMMPDGHVIDTQQLVSAASGQSTYTILTPLEEGFLLSVALTILPTSSVKRGQCYAKMVLGRGTRTALQTPTMLLAQGYVSSFQSLAWPWGNNESPLSAIGMFSVGTVIAGADATVAITAATPGQACWRLHSVQVPLTTIANAAVRTIKLTVQVGGTTVFSIADPVTQGTTTTATHLFCLGTQYQNIAGLSLSISPLPDLLISGSPNGLVIQCNGAVAGDTFGLVVYSYEQFINL